MIMTTLDWGEWVLLTSQRGKRWLVKIQNASFSCHMGTIQMRDAVGKEEGEFLEAGEGSKLFLFRPTLADYIFKMKRRTQIIFPKDLGAMIFYGDVQPGSVVLESGVGSGALSLALLRAAGERGVLISVEKRLEFAQLARDNVAKFYTDTPINHHILVGDIKDLALAVDVDRVFLDLPEPWHAVRHVAPFLKTGGILVSLSPNVAQVQFTVRELKIHGFTHIRCLEMLEREWQVDDRRARPKDRMIGHTGFLTIAKRAPKAQAALDEEGSETIEISAA
jgi:tRNA (adenine57-N1/adenine58-N1)-methyltransferase catalytic subunit